MIPGAEVLMPLVEPFLERQGWFESATREQPEGRLELSAFDLLRTDSPGLGRLILSRGVQSFQLLVGWRHPSDLSGALRRRESALLGSIGSGVEQVVIYEALADDVLCLKLLEFATDDQQHAKRVRSVSSLTSHAALVFDDRLFMKCYRVLEAGERNEVVTTVRLDNVGFNALPGPVGRLRAHDFDLIFVREFLPSALEGRMLALTSLRDLLAYAGEDNVVPPGSRGTSSSRIDRNNPDRAAASAGGDLASETFRLGQTVARLHLALREAFGDTTIHLDPLIEELREIEREQLDGGEDPSSISPMLKTITRFADGDLGHAIRLHGELHLRRVMRSEPGWIITGFSDDPLYRRANLGSSLEPRVGSPLEDLADMYFSIEHVAKEALSQRSLPDAADVASFARAWVARNQASFLHGYLSTAGANVLLPVERMMSDALLSGFRTLRKRRYEATFAASSS